MLAKNRNLTVVVYLQGIHEKAKNMESLLSLHSLLQQRINHLIRSHLYDRQLHHAERCPRCGYALRFEGRGYICDFCGYPHMWKMLERDIHGLKKNLNNRVQNLLERIHSNSPAQPIIYYTVAPRPHNLCVACDTSLLAGTRYCPRCGAPQTTTQPHITNQKASRTLAEDDQRVLNYVIDHNGTISLSQAAQDLSMPSHALRSSIERLKTAGFLT